MGCHRPIYTLVWEILGIPRLHGNLLQPGEVRGHHGKNINHVVMSVSKQSDTTAGKTSCTSHGSETGSPAFWCQRGSVSAVPLRSCDHPCIWVKLAQGPARISSYKGAPMGWQPIPMTSLHVRDLMSVIRPQPQSEVLRIESGFSGSGSSHKSIVIGY